MADTDIDYQARLWSLRTLVAIEAVGFTVAVRLLPGFVWNGGGANTAACVLVMVVTVMMMRRDLRDLSARQDLDGKLDNEDRA